MPSGEGERSRLAATDGLIFPGKFLGSGSYGEVHLHEERRSGRQVVLKTVMKREHWSMEDLIAEVEVMQALDHPYVLRILSWYEIGGALGMVMDLCSGGELMEVVRDGRRIQPMPEKWPAVVFAQLFEALAYCHSRGYVHKDIKTENILLLSKPPEGVHVFDTAPHAMLADFGLAESVGTGGVISLFGQRGHEVAGTGYTMAPEVWKGSCGFKADVWSLGVVMFQLFSNKVPFDPPDAVLEPLPHALRANVWLDLHKKGPQWSNMNASKDATAICKDMLKVKERDRPSAQKLRDHAWVKSNAKWWQATPDEVQGVCQAVLDWRKRHPLQKAMCLHLAANAPQDSRLAAVFSHLDRDHNGTLSKHELADGLLAAKIEASLVKKVASSLDFDEAGAISYLELVAAQLPASGEKFDKFLSREFERWNSQNRSGLTAPQMESLLETLMEAGEFDLEPPELTKNKEGLVSFEDFSAFFGRTPVAFKGSVKRLRRTSHGKTKSLRPKKTKKPASTAVAKKPRTIVEPMGIVVPDVPARKMKDCRSHSSSDSDWSWSDSDRESEDLSGEAVSGGRREGDGGSTLSGAASECTAISATKMRPTLSGQSGARSSPGGGSPGGTSRSGEGRRSSCGSVASAASEAPAARPRGKSLERCGRSADAPLPEPAVADAPRPAARSDGVAVRAAGRAAAAGAAAGADAAAGGAAQGAAKHVAPMPTTEFDTLMAGGGRGERRPSWSERVEAARLAEAAAAAERRRVALGEACSGGARLVLEKMEGRPLQLRDSGPRSVVVSL